MFGLGKRTLSVTCQEQRVEYSVVGPEELTLDQKLEKLRDWGNVWLTTMTLFTEDRLFWMGKVTILTPTHGATLEIKTSIRHGLVTDCVDDLYKKAKSIMER